MRGEGVDACGAGSPDPASRGIPSVGGYYGPRVSRPIKAGSAPELEVGDPKNRRAERRRRTHPAIKNKQRRRRRRSAHPSLEGRDKQTSEGSCLAEPLAHPLAQRFPDLRQRLFLALALSPRLSILRRRTRAAPCRARHRSSRPNPRSPSASARSRGRHSRARPRRRREGRGS